MSGSTDRWMKPLDYSSYTLESRKWHKFNSSRGFWSTILLLQTPTQRLFTACLSSSKWFSHKTWRSVWYAGKNKNPTKLSVKQELFLASSTTFTNFKFTPILFLTHCDASHELQQVVFTTSACVYAQTTCLLIGWWAIFVDKHLSSLTKWNSQTLCLAMKNKAHIHQIH